MQKGTNITKVIGSYSAFSIDFNFMTPWLSLRFTRFEK